MSKKILLIVAAFLSAIIGLWVWTFAAPGNSISIGGSASVDPLMQRLTNKYKKDQSTKFSYSSTGSGSGITNVKNGVYKAGFISKAVPAKDGTFDDYNLINGNLNFFLNEDQEDKSQEGYYNYIINKKTGSTETNVQKEDIHYVTFARDSIVFIYNLKGLNFDKFVDKFEFTLNSLVITSQPNDEILPKLDSESIKVLERIYKNDSPNDLWTWRGLAEKLAGDDKELIEEAKKVSNKKIIPYTTTPGSGTRSSFQTITNNKVTPGRAAHAYNSNGAIFSQINLTEGSFGYLSMNYAINTRDYKNFSNLKTAVIVSGDEKYNISDVNQNNWETYPLYRPFIGMFKNSIPDKELKAIANFIYWMTTSKDVKELYEHEYLIKVIEPQIIRQNQDFLLDKQNK